jgi:hypothetical protein
MPLSVIGVEFEYIYLLVVDNFQYNKTWTAHRFRDIIGPFEEFLHHNLH